MEEFKIDGPGLYMTDTGFFVEVLGKARWMAPPDLWIGIGGSGHEIDSTDLFRDDGTCVEGDNWKLVSKVAASR